MAHAADLETANQDRRSFAINAALEHYRDGTHPDDFFIFAQRVDDFITGNDATTKEGSE